MKLISIILTSIIVSTSSYASIGKLVSLTLQDGTKISAKNDIKEITTDSENRIDLVELYSGEIFYDSEIGSASFFNGDSFSTSTNEDDRGIILGMIGGDGSGGG